MCSDEGDLNAFQSEQHLAWKIEGPLNPEGMNTCAGAYHAVTEDLCLLASSSKKQRTEVRLAELTPAERKEV